MNEKQALADRKLAELFGLSTADMSLKELHAYIGVVKIMCELVKQIPEYNGRASSVDVPALVDEYRRRAHAEGKKLGLPDSVFEKFGHGGMRQFVPYCFLDYPMAVFERPSQATSAQMELKLPNGETFTREVYTIRHDKKMALTGRQENVLFTLLNDEFMQLARGPGGDSMIVGSVERLRELTGGRIRMSELLNDLRAIG